MPRSSTVERHLVLLLLALLVDPTVQAVRADDSPAAEGEVAQESKAPLAGHSYHGEAFNEGPRQKAYVMGTTGRVHFAVTTEVEEAQEFFDQGVGQLHGFWYFEAERSFRQVAALAPDCAMAYWGMAMANWENVERARGFIKEAVERREQASERERLWIDGLADYLAEGKIDKARKQRYVKSLEEIIHAHPDDIEAKAFLLVRLWQFQRDLPIPSHVAIDALFAPIFAREPMHPAHHYRIHLWDGERPETALPSAALCGQSAPGIAHMWHMSGHIFSKLERYDDAAWQQEASARVDHAHMMRDRVLPDQIHNYAHNNEWLIRDLHFVGRAHDALSLAKNMLELPRHPRYNTYERNGRSASFGRARLMETLERFELWDEAIELSRGMYLEPTDIPEERRKRLRLLGCAWFGKGDLEGLQRVSRELREELAAAREARKEARKEAASKEREKSEDRTAIAKARLRAGRREKRRMDDLRESLKELRAYRLALLDEKDDATKLFAEVDGPSKLSRSRFALRLGDKQLASDLAREAVAAGENEALPLAALVEALEADGKREAAAEQFERLRQVSARIDLDAAPFQRLTALARDLGYEDDWRVEPPRKEDVGDRPDLDALGPFRWRPSAAPAWELEDADGRSVTLAQFRGRPLVLIFYLGYGCLHCVEQLESFAPKASEFEEAGLSVLAISTESRDELVESLAAFRKDGEAPPFPLLPNGELDIFKAYRVWDDFESQPLHGTFLIDGAGRIRWQDISYEPFNEPEFLIAEAKRLLSMDPGERVIQARF